MKKHQLIVYLVLSTLIACSSDTSRSETVQEASKTQEKTEKKTVQTSEEIDPGTTTSETKDIYSFTYNNREFRVTSNQPAPPWNEWFTQREYGLVSANEQVLDQEYNKIGSPGVLAANCVEVVKDQYCGLFNLETDSLLPTGFDLLLPTLDDSSKAYVLAQLGESWYKLKVSDFSLEPLAFFSLTDYLREHRFGTHGFDSNNEIHLQNSSSGYDTDLIISPHYLVALDLFPSTFTAYEFGTSPQVKTIATKSFGERFISMLVAIYDASFNIRDMEYERIDAIVYNDESEVTRHTLSKSEDMGAYQGYRYLSDSILEVKQDSWNDNPPPYARYSSYNYYFLNDTGGIEPLSSERRFNFTDFAWIDSNYFKGDFEFPMSTEERAKLDDKALEGIGMYSGDWYQNHLSMDDLDIMRNEIFATYGYRFTTQKWKTYFEGKSWYMPVRDNVDDLLTDRDRHNLKVILAAQKQLRTHGEPQRSPVIHSLAG